MDSKIHKIDKTGSIIKSRFILSTILIAILFFPGNIVLPIQVVHAASNPNLFVSAENSQWNNYFAGPQVIQVVVADSDINRLDQSYGEPIVTVNGKKLRMAQATDGNWYAYFADSKQAQIADSTAPLAHRGLNFGQFCSATSAQTSTGIDFSETKGIAIASTATGAAEGTQSPSATISATCTSTATTITTEHVVRENKTINGNAPSGKLGQISTNNLGFDGAWPIIQLYDFSAIPSTVVVDYQKAGGDQMVTLTFDRIPTGLIDAQPDRQKYPENSQVFVTMDDPQLNIDPTEEDSWTWGSSATNNTMFYQLFNRNGAVDADGSLGAQNILGNITSMMFNHNGKLTINPEASGTRVIDFQSNGKQFVTFTSGKTRGDPGTARTSSIGTNSQPITFLESGGVNTGVFTNWDGAKTSNLVTRDSTIIRGQSASIRYNDVSQSIVGGFSFGIISTSAINNTWASGQRIPLTLTDDDSNTNSKITEHRNNYDYLVKRIPTLKIGSPFTLSGGNATFFSSASISTTNGIGTASNIANIKFTNDISEDESISARPIYLTGNSPFVINNGGGMVVDLKTTMSTLRNTIHNTSSGNSEKFKGFNFLNLDLRSLGILGNVTGGSITNVHVYLAYHAGSIFDNSGNLTSGTQLISIANTTALEDFINLNVTSSKISNPLQVNNNVFAVPESDNIGLIFQFETTGGLIFTATSAHPITADFFSIGVIDYGLTSNHRINNGIYRFELEETGDNTGTFTGTNQYVMLNQLNIFDPTTYSSLRTINSSVSFAVIRNMLQSEANAPQVTFLDLGGDGLNTLMSAQQDIQTHTAVLSFDNPSYQVGQTVTITLHDPDLNIDNDLVDFYTSVTPSTNDPAVDTIGKLGLGIYHDGTPFGQLLQVRFNEMKWTNSGCFAVASSTGTAEGQSTSLSLTGFSLIETGPSTGFFTGNFAVPDQVCWNQKTRISTNGTNMEAVYTDFDDSGGNTKTLSAVSVIGLATEHDYNILFKSGPFTPNPGLNITGIQAGHLPGELIHFLLQFKQAPTQQDKDELLRNHVTIGDYVTGNAYLASSLTSDVTQSNLNSTGGARWAGPIIPDYKISYNLKNKIIPNWAYPYHNATADYVALNVQLQNGTDLTAAKSFITNDLHGIVVGSSPNISIMTVIVPYDKIDEITSKDFTLYLDFIDHPLKDSSVSLAQQVVGLDTVQSSLGLDGHDVNILEYDEFRFWDSIPELATRVSNADGDFGEAQSQPHPTEVAGLLLGNGADPSGTIMTERAGMAQGARVFGYTSGTPSDPSQIPFKIYNGTNDLIHDFTDAIVSHSVDVATMSMNSHVGDDINGHCDLLGDYSNTAKIIDSIVHGDNVLNGGIHKNLIFVESAGNARDPTSASVCGASNYATIDPPATAKNSIAVGAILANDPTRTAEMSSYGPTDDGRIKPDIVAPGDDDSSTTQRGLLVPNDNLGNYGRDHGTSMATPIVSGSVALLIEKWPDIFPNTILFPHTVKAILAHTAKNPQGDGPDYAFGWGILDISAAANLLNNAVSDHSIHVAQIGSTNDHQDFSFTSSGTDVKATLVWDDPSAQELAVSTLVNNLDVKLVDSSGHVFNQPFTCGDSVSCQLGQPHQQGPDTKNNIKMVVGHGSAGDTWIARVTGTRINSGPQNFTVVTTSYAPRSTLSQPTITSPDYGQLITAPTPVQGSADSGNMIEVYVDGALPAIVTADSTGSWTTPSLNLLPGTHTIYAIQRSSGIGGHDSLVSNTVVVSVNSPSPPVITFPSHDMTWATNTMTVTGTTTTDTSPIVVTAQAHTFSTSTFSGTSPNFSWSVPITLGGGANQIVVSQSMVQATASPTITVSSTPLVITSPTTGASFTTSPIPVQGTSPTNDPVQIKVNGGPSITTTPVANHWSTSVPISSPSNNIVAWQSGLPSPTVSVTFSSPPPLVITSPTTGASFTTSPIPVQGTSPTNDPVQIKVNGGPSITTTPVANHWSTSVPISSPSNNIVAWQSGLHSPTVSVTFSSPPSDAVITISKSVDNGFFGNNHVATDFNIVATSGGAPIPLTVNGDTHLPPGTYTITESTSLPPTTDWKVVFTQDCTDNNDHTASVTLHTGEHKTCVISNSHCLIATAAFGSELSPQVKYLRDFRDYRILSTHDGSSFMTAFNYWYYSFSPSVAGFEQTQPLMQLVIRDSIYPLLGILTVSEKAYSVIPGEYGSLLAGIIASSMIGAVYFWPFALAAPQLRRDKKLNTKLAIIIFGAACAFTVISIIIDNSIIMIVTTSFVVLSLIAIFAIISAKIIVKAQKNLKLDRRFLKRKSQKFNIC